MELELDIVIKLGNALGIGILIGLERSIGRTRAPSSKAIPSGAPVSAVQPAGSHSPEDRSSTLSPAGSPGSPESPAPAALSPETGLAGTTPVVPAPPSTTPDLPDPGLSKDEEIIGVRTFTILSLVGFVAAMVGSTSPVAAAVILAGAVLLILAMYQRTTGMDPGITTEVAAVGTCGLGMLSYSVPNMAVAIALLMTVVLAMKRWTHQAVRTLRRVELTDTLKFLVIILIVLPLLPNRALDPWGAFNPYKVTFLVILISGISFVGYFLTKFLGASRGLGLTGLLGGLTSSTAVTAAMASQAKAAPSLRGPCAFATILANATMFARVLVVVALLDLALMYKLAWSIGTMTVVALIAVVVLWVRSSREKETSGEASSEVSLTNPFSLGPALKFAAFFVVILLVAKVAKLYFGDRGLYLAALVSGLADVDAITLSIAEQARNNQLQLSVGAIGITIAVVSNSVVKSGIAIYSGGWRFGALVAAILMLSTIASLGVLLLV